MGTQGLLVPSAAFFRSPLPKCTVVGMESSSDQSKLLAASARCLDSEKPTQLGRPMEMLPVIFPTNQFHQMQTPV